MKKMLSALPFLFLLASLVVGCSGPFTPAITQAVATPGPVETNTPVPPTVTLQPTATPEPATPTATEALELVLEISGPNGTRTFTMAELQALPAIEGQAGIKSSTGKITVPELYTGVALEDLAALVGDLDSSVGINVVAEDGYAMTLSYDQVARGDFIAYSPATGDEVKIEDPLKVVVAYARSGQPLSPESDGTLRLAIISPKNNQVTDGHWSVKWVNKIELEPLGQEWGLKMKGAIEDTLDRNTFQSCAAPGCHQATWTDDHAQPWVGVPLWTLLGRVDDEIKHEGPAFYDLLADLGYTVELVAADGYTVSLDSQRVKRADELVVAYLVNDNPLPDQYFPLRLVGPGLEKDEMIGGIAEINLNIAPAIATQATVPGANPTPEPQVTEPAAAAIPALPAGASLLISGEVEQDLALTEANLRSFAVVQLTAEHPKKGKEDYAGVYLNVLLDLAKVKAGATKLVLAAADGYSIEVDLAAVQACADCLVAFTDTPEKFKLVMPGMESSAWVKDIIWIGVKG